MSLVTVPLTNNDIFDLQSRIEEVHIIREWVCELVGWDETKFKIRYLGSSDSLNIWFDDEKHAMLCALRWQ